SFLQGGMSPPCPTGSQIPALPLYIGKRIIGFSGHLPPCSVKFHAGSVVPIVASAPFRSRFSTSRHSNRGWTVCHRIIANESSSVLPSRPLPWRPHSHNSPTPLFSIHGPIRRSTG